VVSTVPRGTPAESGEPNVAAPLPALTSSASAWPWIRPVEFHDDVTPGVSARRAQCAHGRFGAARDAAEHVDRRIQAAQGFGEANLPLGRRAEGQSTLGCLLHRADHLRMGVSQDGGAPATYIIDVLFAVGAHHACAGTPSARTPGARRPREKLERDCSRRPASGARRARVEPSTPNRACRQRRRSGPGNHPGNSPGPHPSGPKGRRAALSRRCPGRRACRAAG